jgi:hypothetical protein
MGENAFDRFRTTANSVVRNIMAYAAVWIPSDGSKPEGYSAKVLFKNPTENKELAGVEYDPDHYQMEYTEDQFPGLRALVADNNGGEQVTLNNVLYNVQHINTKFDGNAVIADLYPE